MHRTIIYEAVYDSARDGVIVSDDLDTIILVNNEIENLFGYTDEELIGQKMETLFPKEFLADHTKQRDGNTGKPIAAKKRTVTELWVRRKDGSELAVEISWNPIQVEGKTLFSALIRDVTERKIAENKIRDSEERLQSILNNMLEGVQIISFDFRYLYVNDALVKQSGYKRSELLGYTMMEKYPGIENTEIFKRIKESINTGQGCVLENEFIFPDGSTGYFKSLLSDKKNAS